MCQLAKVLSFINTLRNSAPVGDVECQTAGSFNVTAQHMASPGDDSQPLPGDYAAVMKGAGSGQQFTVGYVDPVNSALAGAGEKRLYARDSGSAPVCAVWLKRFSSTRLTASM